MLVALLEREKSRSEGSSRKTDIVPCFRLSQFFAASGIKDSYQTQLILSGINVIGTFPGLFAVDKMGRRTVLFIGSAIMFSGQIIAGSVNTARKCSNYISLAAGGPSPGMETLFVLADPDPVFASPVPDDPAAGKALIFASCWFIFGFAS